MQVLKEDRICSLCGHYIYKGEMATEHNITMDYAGVDTVQHYRCMDRLIDQEREGKERP